jgi:ABC-2 type transport system ATP-binding protein
VINKGELVLVEEKRELMRKMGRKQLILHLNAPMRAVPSALARYDLTLAHDGRELVYTYDTQAEHSGAMSGITGLLDDLAAAGIEFRDLQTTQSSLEEIFVDLVRSER